MEENYTPIKKLLFTLEKTGKQYDIEKIKKAYLYAAELHEGQFRVSGEPFVYHPIAVAEIVATLELDTDSICAALLHDTVEDCGSKVDVAKLRREFGEDVAMLVDGLTKLVQIPFEDKEEEHVENLRKMFLAMSKDIRVIFIKLCDRLHNMRTLDAKRPEKQRMTALETMYVYAPLAHRLGMQRIKQELENLSLWYLDPIGYTQIKDDIEKKYGQNRDFVESARTKIAEKLDEANLKYSLEGRVKTVYSLYKKMFGQNKNFEEIFDFYALRIIVDTELECYTVLGIVHDMFNSVPGRFKDYISTPKPNMYRSLHTTVIGRDGVPFEIQIRTWDMHRIAEYGIAAHWKYKSGAQSKADIDQKLQWVAKLIDAEDETKDADEFMHTLKIDIFHDETFVFTPKGDVITLPQGSTVIDFAYAIHSAVGNKMVGAKINGMIVPIDRIPQNGEIVEILTSNSGKGPSRDWLKIVKTGEARTKIRQWFKKEKQAENILMGKAEIDKEFKKFNRHCTEEQRNEILANIASRIGVKDVDTLYSTLGYGGLSMNKITVRLKDEFDRVVKPETTSAPVDVASINKNASPSKSTKNGGVIIDGVDGCSVKFARCCNPLPGDDLIGFITKGYGVSIHKLDCPNVKMNLPKPEYDGRWVSAHWERGANLISNSVFEAMLQIHAHNSISLLAEITMVLADMRVSLISINTQKSGNNDIIVNLTVNAKNLDHVNSITSRLKSIKNINDVTRGFG
ncbi:MAG: bifunctional (p)ppGpp synthetase/guanosine-3',5'-bis(diphosphate) 3'-pyrophosphohydrolase [Ruminococcaceae bacterium]|nr:bifunctional (p)ppGpp synthetase/guanosine-3',5'-bis(diphosphate) 3'-pyrophosphohydrolase [Oscillospiraceae bacterium]